MDSTTENIGAAIGRLPSGCSILTVEHDGCATGVLVSWVQQASFEPPCVSVCMKLGRPANELIEAAGRFVLNLIGEDPSAMFKHFGRGFSLEEDAFAGVETATSEYGPILNACIAHMGCRLRQTVTVGDHQLLIAEIEVGDADGKPYVHLRKNGFSY